MKVVRIICWAVIGAVLASGGITWRDWQLYVALGLVSVISLLSEAISARMSNS